MKAFRTLSIFVLLTLLSSCEGPHLFQSEAYKSGVAAGKELNKIRESTDTVASWAKVFGVKEDQINQVTGNENCENVWLVSGLIAYHLKNTEKNHKDFVEGCNSVAREVSK